MLERLGLGALWLLNIVLAATLVSIVAIRSCDANAGGVPLTGLAGAVVLPAVTCPASGEARDGEWVNQTGQTVYVYEVSVFMGMAAGSVADFATKVWLDDRSGCFGNQCSVLLGNNWDHYAEPTAVQATQLERTFTPNYFVVLQGQALHLHAACTCYSASCGYDARLGFQYSTQQNPF